MDLLAPYLRGGAMPDPGDFAAVPCESLLDGAASPEDAAARLPRALGLVAEEPESEERQVIAARLLELTRRRDGLPETWAALHRRFPRNPIAFRLHLRWLRRAGKAGEGGRLVEQLGVNENSDAEDLLRVAELWSELSFDVTADRCFRAAIGKDPSATRPRVLYARRLKTRGEFLEAAEVLSDIEDERLSASAREIVAQVARARQAMAAIAPRARDAACTTAAALKSALLMFEDREPRQSRPQSLEGVLMVTGSLGAGGAERQLVRIARALSERARSGQPIAGVAVEGPIEISVSNASKVAGNAFHVTETEACGLRLTDLSRATPAEPAFPGRYEILTDLLPIIPKPAVFGLERLLPVIKRRRPEVVYVWQDGAVLMAALAALAAGVPRIVLSLRGMPPNLRTNIAKQEFRDMYAALARVPGVSFTANNRAAARAYCRWLDLPWSAFTVIPNAIERPPTDAAQHEIDLWNDFDARTRGAGITLGGVFRFEPNKRPRLWIEFAARLLSADPRWRFVLVGGGRQFSECRELAARLGVAGRILFVGHSHNVGFWLGKMDVLSLLSEHEGLPNVLLEAQATGVPVVATPAGGATEALDAGRTGMLLDSAEAPRFADYAQKLGTITRDPRDLARMKLAASTRAEELFAVGRVLAHTVAHFKGQELHGPSPARDRPVKLERTA